tara:strand:- start:1180 stop:1449 length:270 start_codon:yes stop_codon:yes gene_type:complete
MKDQLCQIYKCSREKEMYLYVAADKELSELPEDLMMRLGNLSELMTLQLNKDTKLARVKAVSVLQEIEAKGYFLQMPPNIHVPVFTYGG